MLSSIHPFGERARNSRWGITASAFIVGAIAGGTVMGAVLGAAGLLVLGLTGVPTPAIGVVAALVVASAMVVDVRRSVPSIKRQVDENWLNAYRGWIYGGGFGFQLGLGLDVVVTTAAVYAAFALAFLSASVTAGVAIGGAFGAVRGLTILTGARIDTPQVLRSFHRRLQSYLPAAHRLVLASEVAAVAAVVVALSAGWVT